MDVIMRRDLPRDTLGLMIWCNGGGVQDVESSVYVIELGFGGRGMKRLE